MLRNTEEFADNFLRRRSVGSLATAHLHPARAYAEVGGLDMHHYSGDGGIFDISLALRRVAGNDYCQAAILNRGGVRRFEVAQPGKHIAVFDHDKLPRTGTFRRGCQQSGLKYSLDIVGREGLVGIASYAVTLEK